MTEKKKDMNEFASRKLARLAVVQALYQSSYEQETLAQIIREKIEGKFPALREEDAGVVEGDILPDADLFTRIAEGVVAKKETLDEMIAGAVDSKISSDRMEILLKTVLRAGVYELYCHSEYSAAVIVNDYVDVAKAFFSAKEPGLVNAVLDKIASKLR